MSDTMFYNPKELERELKPFYISATQEDINHMLSDLGLLKLEDLFLDIPEEVRWKKPANEWKAMGHDQLALHMKKMASKNKITPSFIGDGLSHWKTHPIVEKICRIRGLTTAYTPYQPERGQGTLIALWLYSSSMAKLTGFEAINASLYDRASAIFEALQTSTRLKKNKNTVIVAQSLYPGDWKVLLTLAKETKLNIIKAPLNPNNGLTSIDTLKNLIKEHTHDLAALCFPQVNCFGNLEEVDLLTDLASQHDLISIGVIDPLLLAKEGMNPPSIWGSNAQGTTMFVAEGQHLVTPPTFGGPGLGIFGIRYNDTDKLSIRSTPGRFVGKAKDQSGKTCFVMILSTREQHIRREKATSNICSNQSFMATICGATLLALGDEGMSQKILHARKKARWFAQELCRFQGVEMAFGKTPFYNSFTLEVSTRASEFIHQAKTVGLELGVDVTDRTSNNRQLIQITVTDHQTDEDFQKVITFLKSKMDQDGMVNPIDDLSSEFLRRQAPGLKRFEASELEQYYQQLGTLNVSPDDHVYPLGSCTMKYNPYINEFAAGLLGMTQIHPQAPYEHAQGNLEILYEIQEKFKWITGLPGVTTQPLAGAQGELVGIKMFQAYHRDQGQNRDVIIIPTSAHGTNPASAMMAGIENKKVDGLSVGIITVNANSKGQIDMEAFEKLVHTYKRRLIGVMITNPNTSGIFEQNFKHIADLVHSVGGLVYMDGANMNAIACQVDLNKLGVDAVHNNLHKTWSIPHGGGGPGDAIVAVSEKLMDYMPGLQVVKDGQTYTTYGPTKSIGSFHRHWGNFGHKVRAYTYLGALGFEGIQKMSAVAVLSARYLFHHLNSVFPTLPQGTQSVPRMHEFILTLSDEEFARLEQSGLKKTQIIPQIGKLFLDFGLHAPTVAFPEPLGLMIEPTESFSKKELDHFIEIVKAIKNLIMEHPQVLVTAPHFTPIQKVDEVEANKNVILWESIDQLPTIYKEQYNPRQLGQMPVQQVCDLILQRCLKNS